MEHRSLPRVTFREVEISITLLVVDGTTQLRLYAWPLGKLLLKVNLSTMGLCHTEVLEMDEASGLFPLPFGFPSHSPRQRGVKQADWGKPWQ